MGETSLSNNLKSIQRSFDQDIVTFVKCVESLSITLPLVGKVIGDAHQKALADTRTFLDPKATLIQEDKEKKRAIYEIRIEHFAEFKKIQKEVEAARIANIVVPQSFIVSLVSQFDIHLGRLIRTTFYVKPELLNASQRNLTFSELVGFGSIENAREFVIEKEIESALRKSHSEQFSWLETKLNIPLRKDLQIWTTFIELTERRNLFVHTDGVVSSQYLAVCKEAQVPFDKEPSVGEKLDVTPDYFEQAYRCIFEMGVKLGHVIWRKLVPDEIEIADQNLNKIGYELVLEKEYDLAINILEFGTDTCKTHSTEEKRLMMVVNMAQAYKWKGNEKKCKAILDKVDWSASDTKFKLANAVLLDNFELAASLMKRIGKSDENVTMGFTTWPLFQEFRKSQQFRMAYKEIFGKDFEIVEEGNLPTE